MSDSYIITTKDIRDLVTMIESYDSIINGRFPDYFVKAIRKWIVNIEDGPQEQEGVD